MADNSVSVAKNIIESISNNECSSNDYNICGKNLMLILQGIPGSGKSTFVKHLRNFADFHSDINCISCSNDDYFLDDNNKYNFSMMRINQAINSCFGKCLETLLELRTKNSLNDIETTEKNIIIIDNTHLDKIEYIPYIRLAEYFNIECRKVLFICNDYEKVFSRNIHNLPEYSEIRFYSKYLNILKEVDPFTIFVSPEW